MLNWSGYEYALLFAFCIAAAVFSFSRKRSTALIPGYVLGLALLLLLVGAYLAIVWRVSATDKEMREDLRSQVLAIASSVSPDDASTLSFTPSDKGTPVFERFASQLAAYSNAINCRGIYTLKLQDATIYFGPESYPESDPFASPPGVPYEEPPNALLEAFRDAVPAVHGPYRDEYGEFVSAFAPVFRKRGQPPVMMIGLDIEAGEWQAELGTARKAVTIVAFLIALAFCAGWVMLQWGSSLANGARSRYWRPETLSVIVIGVALTVAMSLLMYDTEERHWSHVFRHLARGAGSSLAESVRDLRDDQLQGLARLFESSQEVDRAEFSTYALPLLEGKGISGIAWFPEVKGAELREFENSMRASGSSGYHVWQRSEDGVSKVPVEPSEVHFPIQYIEPHTSMEGTLGFDMFTNQPRRQAIEEALRTGLTTVTEPLYLMLNSDADLMLVFLRPVYAPEQVGLRKTKGFVAIAVSIQQLLEESLPASTPDDTPVALDVFLLRPDSSPTHLAGSCTDITAPVVRSLRSGLLHVTTPILAGGRAYAVSMHPGPSFESDRPFFAGIVSALLGLFLTGLTAFFVTLLTRRRNDLEDVVEHRTEELREKERRLSATLKSIGDAVISTDRNGMIVNMNPIAEALTGWTSAEAAGLPSRQVFRIVHGGTGVEAEDPVQRAIAEGVTVELHNHTALIARSGVIRQVADSCAPIRSESGEVEGAVLVFRDVTEEYRRRQEIRESEARYRLLMDAVNVGIVVIDSVSHKIEQVNQAAATMFGAVPDEIVGNECHIFLCPADKGKCPITDLGMDVENSDRILLCADGTTKPILKSVRKVRIDGVEKLLETFVDISDRKLAEAELEASREQFRLAMQGSQDGFWDWNLRTNELYLSPRWKELLGYADNELPNTFDEFSSRLHPEDSPRVEAYLAEYLRGERRDYSVEFRMKHRDGHFVDILARGEAIRDENGIPWRMAGSHTDITDRKNFERRLLEDEARIRAITDSAQDAILMMDTQGRISYWNPAAETLFGWTAAEALGRHLHDLIAPERYRGANSKAMPLFQKSGRGAAVGKTLELEAVHRDGHEISVSLSLSALKMHDGWHAVGILRDVTEKKRTEAEMREVNRKLERAIAGANELAEKAMEASRAKSEFLANMSHEIRTPLNGVIGMTGLLLDTELGPEQRQYAEIVRTSGEALLDLINDILDFSKIEARKLEVEMIELDLRELLEETAELLALKAHEKGLELAYMLDPALPARVIGDPGRVRQVLINLGGNAVKFTHEGSVSIRASLETRGQGSVTVRFSVTDTGIGIPADKQAILFSPFTQVDGSTTRKYGGTGLGLAISRELAVLMGGEIGLESEEGRGSTFWFTAAFGEAGPDAPEDAEPADLAGVKALVVDDNPVNRILAVTLLESWGCICDEAESGEKALLKLRIADSAGTPFSLGLIDMQMPGMEGAELARRIRSDRSNDSMVLVMMTSVVSVATMDCPGRPFFAACLPKPLRKAQLHDCLRKAVGLSRKHENAVVSSVDSESDRESRKAVRLLLAEDSPTNRLVAVKILQKLGYSVDTVANGKEAIEALQRIDYGLVLMDCQMPEMDGFEATEMIREAGSGVCNPRVPIIAMTAHAMAGDRERCIECGMDDYLSKPVQPAELARMLDKWLSTDTDPQLASE